MCSIWNSQCIEQLAGKGRERRVAAFTFIIPVACRRSVLKWTKGELHATRGFLLLQSFAAPRVATRSTVVHVSTGKYVPPVTLNVYLIVVQCQCMQQRGLCIMQILDLIMGYCSDTNILKGKSSSLDATDRSPLYAGELSSPQEPPAEEEEGANHDLQGTLLHLMLQDSATFLHKQAFSRTNTTDSCTRVSVPLAYLWSL